MTTNERVPQDMTSKACSQNERISTWLKVEMTIVGSKDLPIHIDADIEDDDKRLTLRPIFAMCLKPRSYGL